MADLVNSVNALIECVDRVRVFVCNDYVKRG